MNEALDIFINENWVNYKGVLVMREGKGFRALGKYYATWKEATDAINKAFSAIKIK